MKLPKIKNPLQAAADFAQRMAGESDAPAPKKPAPAPRQPEPVYQEPVPTYIEEEPPVYRPEPQPKKAAPRRKSTPMEDIRYTLWAICIAISVAATALCFLIGAVS